MYEIFFAGVFIGGVVGIAAVSIASMAGESDELTQLKMEHEQLVDEHNRLIDETNTIIGNYYDEVKELKRKIAHLEGKNDKHR